MERLHPDDVRAFLAGFLTAVDYQREGGVSPVKWADDLLAELASTANPTIQARLADAEKSVDYWTTNSLAWQARAEKAEAEVERLGQEVANLTYSNNEHHKMAETWREKAATADVLEQRLAAIDAARAGEPERPKLCTREHWWSAEYWYRILQDHAEVLSTWGREGWDSAAALRASLAAIEGRIHEMCKLRVEIARDEATHAERERIRKALRLLRWNYLLQDGTGVRTFRAEDVDAALADAQPAPAEKEVPNA